MLMRLLVLVAFIVFNVGFAYVLVRGAFPNAWENGQLRRISRGIIAIGAVGLALQIGGAVADSGTPLRLAGMALFAPVFVSSVLLVGSSPLWALPRYIMRRQDAAVGEGDDDANAPADPGRRLFFRQTVERGTQAAPVAAGIVGPVGTAAALLPPRLKKVTLSFDDLPDALDGFRILHLTDVHLGNLIDVNQVQAALDVGRPHKPDLIALTGDISDDYTKLGPALDAIEAEQSRLGSWACIGNHEIYRGRDEAMRIYKASQTPLLVNEGRVLDVDGAKFFVAGIDDPARLGQDHTTFLRRCVDDAAAQCPADVDFKLLLAHRPESFEAAAPAGFDLTLSGHTHGGQVSLFGRSLFEPLAPRAYLLGHYQKGSSHLHTSAGTGHWFPLRINCPCEVILVELRQKKPGEGRSQPKPATA